MKLMVPVEKKYLAFANKEVILNYKGFMGSILAALGGTVVLAAVGFNLPVI